MFNHWLPIEGSWMWIALDISAKATVLLIVVGLLALLSDRGSAALRHRVWALSFVALALLPLASLALPGAAWQIIPRDWRDSPEVAQPAVANEGNAYAGRHAFRFQESETRNRSAVVVPHSDEPAPLDDAALSAAHKHPDVSDLAQSPSSSAAGRIHFVAGSEIPQVGSASDWLMLVWLSGALVVLLPLVSGILGNLVLKLRSKRVSDDMLLALLRDLKGDLGLKREVRLLLTDQGQMPMTFGFLRPCVVLPADALAWSTERRRIVLLHELAHVERHDVAWQIVARVGCACIGFIHWSGGALGRMRMDREHACDDCVLAAGHKASGYATHLLEIARVHRACSPLATAALSMARRSQLEGRLLAVLDSGRKRSPLGHARATGLLLSMIAAVTGIGRDTSALRSNPPSRPRAATHAVQPPTATRRRRQTTSRLPAPSCRRKETPSRMPRSN